MIVLLIHNIKKLYNLSDFNQGNNSFGVVVVYETKRYFEIKQIKAYPFDSFTGNVGGYMGLFLGYAILNLPTLTLKFIQNAKQKFENRIDQIFGH